MSELESKAAWIRALEIASTSTIKDFQKMASAMWGAAFEFGFNAGAESMRGPE